KIWYGKADRTFESVEITVNGTYNPAAGDFDGNGTTDVVWSGANVTEPMWLFSDTERGERIAIHTSSMLGSDTAGGDSVPYAGDFDGNGFADLYWFKP
ncbi:MAG TPA: VCBS repeat-containing protein, partial [Polyangiaceae bacterium]